ncbi:MAG: hypothetical protein JWM88_1495 [Verrucomicrobia bacterium]|nr:hypothetical protein [Verrucomicrobiota bacterium]
MKIPRSICLPALPFAILVLSLAGCQSPAERRSAAMEEARRSVPAMSAQETFFDGRIAARISLGSSVVARDDESKGPGEKGKGGHAGGGRHHGGGGRRGGGGGESMGGESSGADAGSSDSGGSEDLRPRYVDSPMPPALLQLRLENTSAEAVTVEIHDLNSELGNFATRPDTFTIEPGGSAAPGAMKSLLGVDSLALPVTLTLRVSGKLETKVLTLRPDPQK